MSSPDVADEGLAILRIRKMPVSNLHAIYLRQALHGFLTSPKCTEAQVRSQACPCWICSRHSGTGTSLPPYTCFPCSVIPQVLRTHIPLIYHNMLAIQQLTALLNETHYLQASVALSYSRPLFLLELSTLPFTPLYHTTLVVRGQPWSDMNFGLKLKNEYITMKKEAGNIAETSVVVTSQATREFRTVRQEPLEPKRVPPKSFKILNFQNFETSKIFFMA